MQCDYIMPGWVLLRCGHVHKVMGRRKLALTDLNLGPNTRHEDVDRAEEIANRILDSFDLELPQDQFEGLCELIDTVALDRLGEVKDTRSVAGVCRAVGEAHLPDEVRIAILLVLLKEPIRRVRNQVRPV